jgi:hypothetical protein
MMPDAQGAKLSYSLIDRSPGERRRSIPFIQATAMRRRTKIALAVTGLAIMWPFLQIGLIAAQAQYYAGGRPYCIDVSDHYRSYRPTYRPAASLFDLNGFTLHAPYIETGGSGSNSLLQLSFHAVLVVEDGHTLEWRNWSYWHQHLDRLTPEQVRATSHYNPVCQLQRNYVWKLPLFSK